MTSNHKKMMGLASVPLFPIGIMVFFRMMERIAIWMQFSDVPMAAHGPSDADFFGFLGALAFVVFAVLFGMTVAESKD